MIYGSSLTKRSKKEMTIEEERARQPCGYNGADGNTPGELNSLKARIVSTVSTVSLAHCIYTQSLAAQVSVS